jgi:hypothetical protein
VPHKSGNVYVYDSPRQASVDYDIPPSRYKPATNGRLARSSPVPPMTVLADRSGCDYDVPPAFTQHTDVYDSPPTTSSSLGWNSPRGGVGGGGESSFYDVPSSLSGFESDKISLSNRSSVLSMLSTDSRSSLASGRSGSSPATSARSSIDIAASHEIYDIPRPSADRSVAPPSKMPLQCAKYVGPRDSVLDDYAVPRDSSSTCESRSSFSTPKDDEGEIYDTPKSVMRREYDNPVYDVPPIALNATPSLTIDASQSVSPNVRCHSSDRGTNDEPSSGADRQLAALRDTVAGAVERFLRFAGDADVRQQQQQLGKDSLLWYQQLTSSGAALLTSLRQLIQHGEGLARLETDSPRRDGIRGHCEILNRIFSDVSAHLDQLLVVVQQQCDEPATCNLRNIAELVRSVASVPTTVDDLCSLLRSQSMACPLTSKNGAPEAADVAFNAESGTCSLVSRGLPPPPVLPKPVKTAQPAKVDITERPLPPPPTTAEVSAMNATNKGGKKYVVISNDKAADYDYVLIAEEAEQEQQRLDRTESSLLAATPSSTAANGSSSPIVAVPNDVVLCAANGTVGDASRRILNDADRELIVFYEAQVRAHVAVVEAAVADFCRYASACGSADLSPETFVQRSKLVVLAAHKLVYVGDSIARHVADGVVCDRVAAAANELCDQLKVVVTATKEAALLSPHNAVLRLRAIESVKAAAAACCLLNNVLASLVS